MNKNNLYVAVDRIQSGGTSRYSDEPMKCSYHPALKRSKHSWHATGKSNKEEFLAEKNRAERLKHEFRL